MQANPYGLETAVHNCEYGDCSAASQCSYNMKSMGVETYGADAYGSGGTLIDTDQPFTIWTQFLSDENYASLWGMRTTMTQGDNEMVLEADCTGYINYLDYYIEGNMGYIFSAWDNTDGFATFEADGTTNSGTCENAVSSISDISFNQWGSNEGKDVPVLLDPDLHDFIGDASYWGGLW